MKQITILAAFIIICFVACTSTESPSGYKFTVLRKGDGVKVDSGKFMVMEMIFKDGKDSVWSDTRKNGFPAIIQMQDSVPKGDGVLEILSMMTKGDSISFKIGAKDLFTKTFRQPVPPMVDSTSQFTFFVSLKDVMDEGQVRALQNDLVMKQNEIAMQEAKIQLAKDTVIIDNYLSQKNIQAQKTASGLRYIVTKPGKGANAKAGQTVKVHYAGYLLNGKYFDSSILEVAKANNLYQEGGTYEPLEVVLGYNQVIQGWEESLMLMNKGSKITVFIPSGLAYGPQSRGDVIPANSVLAFDMEMVDIK